MTGTGSGPSGSNVDVAITDPRIEPDEVGFILRRALESLHIPQSVTIQIDGRVFKL